MNQPRAPLVVLTPEQIDLETRRGRSAEAAVRAWRRQIVKVVVWCFLSQAVATVIGLAGFTVANEQIGWLLVNIGQIGVVAFPFVLGVLWVAEMDRRGDL